MTDRSHFAPVDAKDETPLLTNDSQSPRPACRKALRQWRGRLATLRQYAYESDDPRTNRQAYDRIGCYEAQELAASTNHYLRIERQPASDLGAQLCLTNWFTDHESTGSSDVQNVESAQLLGEHGRTKSSVPTYVYASQQDDECHTPAVSPHVGERLGAG